MGQEPIIDVGVDAPKIKNLPEVYTYPDSEKAKDAYLQIKSYVNTIVVDNETVYDTSDYLKKLRNLIKWLKSKKVDAAKELRETIVMVQSPYNTAIQELEKLDKTLSDKQIAFQQAKREADRKRADREKAEKEAKIQALKEAKIDSIDPDEITEYENAIEKEEKQKVKEGKSLVKGFESTASLTQKPKYEIVDSDAVPREYCEPSAGKIWNVVKGLTTPEKMAEVSIPGVRIWLEDTVAVR